MGSGIFIEFQSGSDPSHLVNKPPPEEERRDKPNKVFIHIEAVQN